MSWITTKSQSVLPIGRPNRNTKFQCSRPITSAVIKRTDRQNDRQTDMIVSLAEVIIIVEGCRVLGCGLLVISNIKLMIRGPIFEKS